MMTLSELKSLIESDLLATQSAINGDYHTCSLRCSEIAPVSLKVTKLGYLGILGLYPNPLDGSAVLTQMQLVAQNNPLIALVWQAMNPTVPQANMPDWSLPIVRTMLTTPVELGGIGLTEEQASPILRVSEYKPTISADDIMLAWNEDN